MENNNKKRSNLEVVENNTKKVMTKYDKKVQEKKRIEEREKRNKNIFRISVAVILAAILIGTVSYFIIRHNNIYGEYISVGDNEISKVEFDYYTNTTANNFVSTYSSYLSYFGLDTSKSYADQQYSDDMTWADYFAQGAVEQIKQTKALVADAKNNNFKYDVTSDYNSFKDSLNQAAGSASQSLKKYYQTRFGSYATESNLESIIKDYLTASAYYNQLLEQNTPSDSDISAYYEQNKDKYDSIDYRVLSVTSEDTANQMLAKVKDESSFAELCKIYASDSDKSKYESDDASLVKGGTSSSISSVYSSWLYDSSRQAGDKTVIADTNNDAYYVLYFGNRYFDDKNNTTISNTMASDAASKYIAALTDKYTVKDKHNHLKYLSTTTEAASENQ